MSDRVFDGQIFAEKLFKLNRSQQSIESLSLLCISHRKKARQIVETWDKAFCTAQREQRVSFLYLANDILQNSRRNGSEFVNEFWKVLPAALKHVYENGDENGKKEACRLVGIWEERKVFGSRGQNLKDEMLGKHPPPSISNGRSSNPVKIVKRDDHSLRVKLSVGGMPEKILTAFQLAHDENVSEETALNKCKAAASLVGQMEKDVENTSAQGNHQGSLLIEEIQEQENVLEQCVSQLENAEATRGALVSQLKEAIQEQELKLDLIHMQLHVARGHIKHLGNMKHMLTSPPVPASLNAATNHPTESPLVVPTGHPNATNQPSQPVISFASLKSSEEENKKAAAAAVAAKLTASTSSAQMLTSILSSLVAEEAASMSTGGLKSAGFTMFSSEKRPRLENPMPVTDVNSSGLGSSTGYFASLHSIQTNQMQVPFPPPPPPPIPPGNSPANQFVQTSGVMMGVTPYAYGASSLPPPPPPLPSHIAQTLARPPPQPPLPQQQQAMNGGYYRPPPVPRQ